jgi:hypothetical protein
MYGDLKLTFTRKAQEEYMQRTIRAIRAAMKRGNVGKTDQTLNSFTYTATDDSSRLIFDEALRFVDMGVGRKHPLGGLKATRVALLASKRTGDVLVKDNVRRAKKVYSKTAYGNLNFLEGKILYGFTEETIAMLKAELDQKPTP